MFLEGLWLSVFVVSVFKQQLRIRACATCSCLVFNQNPPPGLLIFLLGTAACIKRCRNAECRGHNCCTVDTWVLLTWPDVLETLKGAHGSGRGYGSNAPAAEEATAETPFLKNPSWAVFVRCRGMCGCLGPAWGVLSDSFHGVFSWAFPQPSKIKHDNLFP